jgi:hypothetical protein
MGEATVKGGGQTRLVRQAADGGPEGSGLRLSDGEVHFLYWFIQGSIMNPDTRRRLQGAWGFCQRHALAHLAVEFAFRRGWVHGCAVLYDDLMERAVRTVNSGRFGFWLAFRLRQTGPCLMCELGFGPNSPGLAPAELLARGRETSRLRSFAAETLSYWRGFVCAQCTGRTPSPDAPRCRPHLLGDLRHRRPVHLGAQRELIGSIYSAVNRYSRSFRLELQGTDTPADRAGLIAAMGWCSGWSAWLEFAAAI